MTDQVENIILEHLKALRNELRGFQTEVRAEFSDVKQRLQQLERRPELNDAP
jgi:hypothetical protein